MALEVRLLEASHNFEVSDGGTLIVSGERQGRPGPVLGSPPVPAPLRPFLPPGKVFHWEDPDLKLFDRLGDQPPAESSTGSCLTQGDVYKELRLRGYDYGPHFQGILKANLEGAVPPLHIPQVRVLGPPGHTGHG